MSKKTQAVVNTELSSVLAIKFSGLGKKQFYNWFTPKRYLDGKLGKRDGEQMTFSFYEVLHLRLINGLTFHGMSIENAFTMAQYAVEKAKQLTLGNDENAAAILEPENRTKFVKIKICYGEAVDDLYRDIESHLYTIESVAKFIKAASPAEKRAVRDLIEKNEQTKQTLADDKYLVEEGKLDE
jgi:hypothetical protein